TFSDQPGSDEQRFAALSGAGRWQLGTEHTLEASVGYLDAELHQSYDADWVSDAFCERFTCSYGNDTSREIFDRNRDRWIADVRLLGGDEARAAGASRYSVGAYANHASEDLDYQRP